MESLSIHPRVRSGRTAFEKSNTSKPKGPKAKHFDKKSRRLNLRQNACAATRKSLQRAKVPDSAFRMPGSMNQHKR